MNRLGFLKEYAFWKVVGVFLVTVVVVGSVRYVMQHRHANIPEPVSSSFEGLKYSYPAPELADITEWLNSDPMTLAGLKGKVVLLAFWSYSNINSTRALPYLAAWDKTFRDDGLVVIGVHSPEFEFEKRLENVKNAVARLGIGFPVALDDNHATWTAYDNDMWPAQFLIDKDGNVIYRHFGEGAYTTIENNIRHLLNVQKKAEIGPTEAAETPDQTPEVYLGYNHTPSTNNAPDSRHDVVTRYSSTVFMPEESWMLTGLWRMESQRVTSQEPGAALRVRFKARKVYLVMGTAFGAASKVQVKLNGGAPGASAGRDIDKDTGTAVTINGPGPYEIIDQHTSKSGVVDVTAMDSNIEIYAFTFGS